MPKSSDSIAGGLKSPGLPLERQLEHILGVLILMHCLHGLSLEHRSWASKLVILQCCHKSCKLTGHIRLLQAQALHGRPSEMPPGKHTGIPDGWGHQGLMLRPSVISHEPHERYMCLTGRVLHAGAAE